MSERNDDVESALDELRLAAETASVSGDAVNGRNETLMPEQLLRHMLSQFVRQYPDVFDRDYRLGYALRTRDARAAADAMKSFIKGNDVGYRSALFRMLFEDFFDEEQGVDLAEVVAWCRTRPWRLPGGFSAETLRRYVCQWNMAKQDIKFSIVETGSTPICGDFLKAVL